MRIMLLFKEFVLCIILNMTMKNLYVFYIISLKYFYFLFLEQVAFLYIESVKSFFKSVAYTS